MMVLATVKRAGKAPLAVIVSLDTSAPVAVHVCVVMDLCLAMMVSLEMVPVPVM